MNTRMTSARRAAGHPQRGQCAKRLSILDAAADVFCRQGFAGASLDEIAAEACVSRQTIYNHYGDKDRLFTAVVDDVMNRANATLFSLFSNFPEKADNLEDHLTAFAMLLSKNCVCNQDGKFLRRLVQTEGERYPHLFESWRQQGPWKLTTALAGFFAKLNQAGALRIDDLDVAARQFVALNNADLQMITLFGGVPTDEELEKAARNAVRTFLRAYGAKETAADKPKLEAAAG
jgi:AcrR family transcriptional regulator